MTVPLDVGRLMSVPLPVLLRETGAVLFESGIDDPRFLGGVVERGDGSFVLSMPAGRDGAERDLLARYLLGKAVGLDVGPLPEPLAVEHR